MVRRFPEQARFAVSVASQRSVTRPLIRFRSVVSLLTLLLVMLGTTPSAYADKVDALIHIMKTDPSLKERFSAAFKLQRTADARVVRAYISVLGEPNSPIRVVAVSALGRLVDANTDPKLRRAALLSLSQVAIHDKLSKVRKQAETAINRIDPKPKKKSNQETDVCAEEEDTDKCIAAGFDVTPKEAVGYYEKACKNGSGRGCAFAGHMYGWGVGIPINSKQATKYYKRGCKLKYGRACYLLSTRRRAARKKNGTSEANELLSLGCTYGSVWACLEEELRGL